MKIINKCIDINFLENSSIFLENKKSNMLIFDIETTGLSHKNNEVILIGAMYNKNNKTHLVQLFCENLWEEKELLKKFLLITNRFDYTISYNGNTFDIPFINSRLKYHQLEGQLHKSFNIDLLKIAKFMEKDSLIENYKLKTVEKFIGIDRKDNISGKESIELYFNYLNSKSQDILETILLHNFDDIKNLSSLCQIVKFIKLKNYDFGLPKIFLKNSNRYYYILEKTKLEGDFIGINIFSRDYTSNFEMYYSDGIYFKKTNHFITLKLPIFKLKIQDDNYIFLDIDKINFFKNDFNTLSFSEKENLLLLKNKKILFNNITNILKSFYIK